MKHDFQKMTVLMLLSLAVFVAQAAGQQSPSQQNPPASGQAQQPTETPPHVSQEPNPETRKLEQAIEKQQDPHMAYSRVRVRATDDEIVLSGTVLNATAKQNAEDIAEKHAGGKKISNRIRVNPNIQPGPGL
jgi:osmotically-inducible protein OsmY